MNQKLNFECNGVHWIATSEDGENVIAMSDLLERLSLITPRTQNATVKDIKDITDINGIMCYIYEVNGKLSVQPAIQEEDIPSTRKIIGSSGKWGDFIQIVCPLCNRKWYTNVSHIARGITAEFQCPWCESLLKKKRV